MKAFGLFSVKGAPGVTTLALALAKHAPGTVLVEADAEGGELAVRYGISQEPGLTQLAARAHRTPTERQDPLAGVARWIESEKVTIVPAPVEPVAVAAAVTVLAEDPRPLYQVTRTRPVLIDFGRLSSRSASYPLAQRCEQMLLVVRGDAASLGRASEATWIKHLPWDVGFVLVDTGPYRQIEATGVLALPCLGVVPYTRKPLHGRSGAKAVHAVWTGLKAATEELISIPEEPGEGAGPR